MALLLFGEALAQGLHQLVEAELFDLGALLRRQKALGELAQPFSRDFRPFDGLRERQDAFEGRGEDDVEFVEIALVLDQQRARQAVEVIDRLVRQIGLQRAHQIEIFARRHGNMGLPQRGEEREEHGAMLARGGEPAQPPSGAIMALSPGSF
jgi:hypothetical protein